MAINQMKWDQKLDCLKGDHAKEQESQDLC